MKGKQTNQRAELSAAIWALENDSRPLRIVTDANHVHGGVTTWRSQWRANAWMKTASKAQMIDNADLWKRMDKIMNLRPQGHTVTQWNKGHALPFHLHNGQATRRDTWGNTAADGLAGRAARAKGEVVWNRPSAELRMVE